LVRSQQPAQLRTSGRHREIALVAQNRNIHSDLEGTDIAVLSPCGSFFLPSLLSPAFSPHWSTRATPASTQRKDNSHTTVQDDITTSPASRGNCNSHTVARPTRCLRSERRESRKPRRLSRSERFGTPRPGRSRTGDAMAWRYTVFQGRYAGMEYTACSSYDKRAIGNRH